MKKIGIAIVGCGSMGEAHTKAYLAFPERCRIAAFCNRSIEKAERLAQIYAPGAVVSADINDMLTMPEVDAVSICLPPSLHAEAACAALRAGKHVLCEKPMACSPEECDLMLSAARSSGKLLGIVSQNRFTDEYFRAKQLISGGALGRIIFATVDSLWWRGNSYYDAQWRGTWRSEGGGCFMNHAIHHLDLLLWMLSMPDSVSAVILNAAHSGSECEDSGVAVLRYGNAIVRVTASLCSHGERSGMSFHGERGSLSIPHDICVSGAHDNGFPYDDRAAAAALERQYLSTLAPEFTGHTGQIDNFLSAITDSAALCSTGEDGRRVIELITTIYESACTGGEVRLPLEPGDRFCRAGGIADNMPKLNL